ncbi:protein FAM27L-like [Pongo abelii]|uniref:protein FAM27L-like n=1 Tax=Pongo abelii TaxID=9601 RepID=UPI003007A377
MAKPQAESGEAERHPILRPDRMVFGFVKAWTHEEMHLSRSNWTIIPILSSFFSRIKMMTLQPRTKAPQELIVLQERSRPTSEKMAVSFHGSSLRNEAIPRYSLEEEAGNGRWQQSLSL